MDFSGLEPGKPYAYRMGYFYSDVEQNLLLPPVGLDLQGASASVFRTARAPGSPELSFVFGSCRHPIPSLEEIGLPDRGDRVFRTVLDQIEGGRPTDLLLMVGDRSTRTSRSPASQSFAISAPGTSAPSASQSLRGLMSRVPTYMVLDDHEIANNWSMDRSQIRRCRWMNARPTGAASMRR